jgi:hypothetical protein
LYSGNIGSKQGLLDFCKRLQASAAAFELKIHGDGGTAAEVASWVAACGDRRFSFGPLVSEPDFVRALHEADLYVITEKEGSGASFFPSKTIPAMASGTPILAVSSSDSPLGREMRSERIGPWFSWEESRTLPAFLASMQGRREEFALWQSNAVHRSHYYERERCLDLFESVLNELVKARSSAPSHATHSAERWAALAPRTSGNAAAPQTLSS